MKFKSGVYALSDDLVPDINPVGVSIDVPLHMEDDLVQSNAVDLVSPDTPNANSNITVHELQPMSVLATDTDMSQHIECVDTFGWMESLPSTTTQANPEPSTSGITTVAMVPASGDAQINVNTIAQLDQTAPIVSIKQKNRARRAKKIR